MIKNPLFHNSLTSSHSINQWATKLCVRLTGSIPGPKISNIQYRRGRATACESNCKTPLVYSHTQIKQNSYRYTDAHRSRCRCRCSSNKQVKIDKTHIETGDPRQPPDNSPAILLLFPNWAPFVILRGLKARHQPSSNWSTTKTKSKPIGRHQEASSRVALAPEYWIYIKPGRGSDVCQNSTRNFM